MTVYLRIIAYFLLMLISFIGGALIHNDSVATLPFGLIKGRIGILHEMFLRPYVYRPIAAQAYTDRYLELFIGAAKNMILHLLPNPLERLDGTGLIRVE